MVDIPKDQDPAYTFTGQPAEAAHIKDVDVDSESLHHTLGKGATQAAAGNHKHKVADLTDYEAPAGVSDHQLLSNRNQVDAHTQYALTSHSHAIIDDHGALSGLADDDHGAYPLKNGTRATGTWPISITGNADTVDGQHASAFALAGHTHFNYGRPNVAFPIGADQSTGDIVIAHGLGREPLAAFVSADDDGGDCSVFCSIRTWDATNLYAKMRNIGSDEAHVYINWIAF